MTLQECIQFQRAVFAARSWPEVVSLTGIDRRRLANIAATLRRQGFELPELASHPRGSDPSDMTPEEKAQALELNRELMRAWRVEQARKAAEKYRRPA